eukprot:1773236-Pyramimonas_sp.AAC.1
MVRTILRSALGFLHSTRAEGATVLVVTGIDLKTSDASAFAIQSSEFGLLPESGLRNYYIVPERCCRFLHLTRAVGGLQG